MSEQVLIQIAKDDVKLKEAKRIGLDISDPKKFQLQIKSLGNNVVQIVAEVQESDSEGINSSDNS